MGSNQENACPTKRNNGCHESRRDDSGRDKMGIEYVTRKALYSKSLDGETKHDCLCAIARRMIKHGMRYTKIYRVWAGIISRTNYKGDSNYSRYGGRGIKVCERWRIFVNFFEDMGKSYKEGLQIERIDNNGNYEPENCRWATRAEQMLNKSTNHLIEYQGKIKTLKEWADELNIQSPTLRQRLGLYNWPIEKAFNTPVRGI